MYQRFFNMIIATKEAALRAQYKDFKAMDALQLATAVDLKNIFTEKFNIKQVEKN